jgi:hypothetical protein
MINKKKIKSTPIKYNQTLNIKRKRLYNQEYQRVPGSGSFK